MSQSPIKEAGASNTHDSISSASQSAPSYLVPSRFVVNVEHPFIIKNLQKGMKKLGRPKDVADVSILSSCTTRYPDNG